MHRNEPIHIFNKRPIKMVKIDTLLKPLPRQEIVPTQVILADLLACVQKGMNSWTISQMTQDLYKMQMVLDEAKKQHTKVLLALNQENT